MSAHPPQVPDPGDTRFLASDLDAERRRLARSLRRTGLVTALLLALVGALAILTLHHAGEAEERLWQAQLNQARSARFSARPGARALALEAIREAARNRVTTELRDEAIAALAMDDLREGGFTNILSGRDASFAVNADLSLLALAGDDGSIRLRPLFGPGEDRLLPSPGEPVHYLFFSPGSHWLVARHASGFTRAWTVADGRIRHEIRGAHRVTTSRATVRFLPTNPSRYWLADQAGRRLRSIDLDAGTELDSLPLDGVPGVLALANDGRIAVAVGNEAQVWNPQVRRLEHRIRKESTVSALDWNADGSQLALGTEAGHLEIVDFPAASPRPLPGHRALVNAVRFAPDGRKLFSTSWDGTTRFWDAALARPLLVTREGLALQHDPSGRRIAFFRGNTGIGFWDVESSPVFQSLAAPPGSEHHFTDLAVSPDALLVAGVNRQDLVVWELETQRRVAHHGLPGAEGVAWSPEGTRLVTASAEGLTRWEFRREGNTPDQRLRKVPDPQRPRIDGRFHQVSPSLTAASASDSAWLLRPWETNAPVPVPHGTVTTFAHVTCDPAGRIVVASLWKGGGTWMRDLDAGTEPRELEPIGGFARFTPDGLFLLTGSNRGYRLWDVNQWRECARLDQQLSSDFPGLGLFTPDGQHAFVIHGHRRIAQVTVPDLRQQAVLEAPGEANLYALAYQPATRVLLAGTDDSRVFLWRLTALERALSDLGIPALSSLESTHRSRWDVRPLRWVLVAFATAAVLALHTLWRQRGLVRDYLHIEILMAERNRQLLQAREELLHGHKMQALGQITAGVAHDLRNLLSVISLSNGLIRRGVASQPELAEEADAVDKAVERGRTLVLALLGYSRRSDEAATPTDTAAVVEDLLRLLGRKFFTGIHLDLSIAAALPPVAVRSAQLEQLLLNLLVNASDAMNGTGTLRVEIGLGALPSGAPWRIVHPSSASSGILLQIADCGPGIAPEVLPRIFEPFFTTKSRSAAAGTGLGLSTVFAIANREDLGLAVRSQPGATVFALLLPLQSLPGTTSAARPA